MSSSSSSSVYQAQREVYRHKLMFELMLRDEEQVDLKRYIRAFVSLIFKKKNILRCTDNLS
jgi:hypothetical protein